MKRISCILFCCMLLTALSMQAQLTRTVKNLNRPDLAQRQIQRPAACSADTVLLTSQAAVDNFVTNYPACTVPNYLIVDGSTASPAITSLSGLSSVTGIAHTIVIQHTSVSSLSALNNITSIGDSLVVQHNPLLTATGLTNLTALGAVYLQDLPLLTNITGLCNQFDTTGLIYVDSTGLSNFNGFSTITTLTTSNGGLAIGHSPVTSLSAFNNLTSSNGYIWLESDENLTNVNLPNLQGVWGFLFSNLPLLTSLGNISHHLINGHIGTWWMINTGLSDLSGLDSLTGVPNFYLWGNNNLTSLHGIEQINGDVTGGFSIFNNQNLTDVSALSQINDISDGTIEFSFLGLLTDASGLGNITHIKGGFHMSYCSGLTSMEFLNHGLVIENANLDSVRIENNTQLALCSTPAICSYLSGGGGAVIHDNAPGCNNITEIQTACSGGMRTWTGAIDADWANPQNWMPESIPAGYDSVYIPSGLTNYPDLPYNISIGRLVMEKGTSMYTNGFNFTTNGEALMDSVLINGGGNFRIQYAPNDSIQSCRFYTNLNLFQFTGNSYFYDNLVVGNLSVSDSSIQTGANVLGGNSIFGNLYLEHNSIESDMSYGDLSPLGATDYIDLNVQIVNHAMNNHEFRFAENNYTFVNGNFSFSSNGDASQYINTRIFNAPGYVAGELNIQQAGGDLSIRQSDIAGKINIQATDLGSLLMSQVHAPATGGLVDVTHLTFINFTECTIGGSVLLNNIEGTYDIGYNQIAGNLVATDSANGSIYSTKTIHNNIVDSNYVVVKKNLTYVQDYLNNIAGDATYTNTSNTPLGIGYYGVSNYGKNLTINNDGSNFNLFNLNFNGSQSGHFSVTGGSLTGVQFSINKTRGTDSVILDQLFPINTGFTFTKGILKTAPGKEILFWANANPGGGSDSSYINGPMQRIGSNFSSFYPLGDGNRYAPVTLNSNPNPNDTLTVEYIRRNPSSDGYDTASHVAGISPVSGFEYWNVSRNAGGASPVEIKLSYNSNRSGPLAQLADLRVAHWNGSQWIDEGNGGTTGNLSSATVKTLNRVNTFSPFTLAFPPTHIPVITMGAIPDTLCQGTFTNIPFTVESHAFPNNTYILQLSDSAGVFGAFPTTLAFLNTDSATVFPNTYIPTFGYRGGHFKMRVAGSNPSDTSNVAGPFFLSRIPQTSFTITGSTTVCPGSQVYNCSNTEGGIRYTWVLSGGGILTSNDTTATVNWTTPGTYTLQLKSATYCGNGPQHTITVTVLQPSTGTTPVINNTGRWLYASQAPLNYTYTWYRNGSLIAGANNAAYYATQAGNYSAKFSSICGITAESNIISFAGASISQTITFPVIPNKFFGDAPFSPNATASSGLPVNYIVVSGPASWNSISGLLSINATGTVTLRAEQSGDNVYDTAAPVTRSFTVNKAPQTITFNAIPDQDYLTGTLSLSASSSSGLPVSFSIVSGPATLSGSTLTMTGVGTVTVSTQQAGDTNYAAASAVNRSFCVRVSALNQISGFTNLCPGTANYTVNNIPGATYTWRIAGGSTLASTASTTPVNWSVPGDYTLIVSASGNCGAASANDSLAVHVISGIQPDSVHNMLPVNGAINQQLPLTLSWVPAVPAGFYTFDIYIWRSDSAQPLIPYVSNISTVNYTIQQSSFLQYNKTYKWMVVAHNGSCTVIHTGPVQQFTLAPLPDLMVTNVLAPATAFSGQTVNINWTVKNNGPGNTPANRNWTDAVFVSFDTLPNFNIPPQTSPAAWNQLEFPLRPLLIGTKPNVNPLDSGQSYSNSISFTLPLNYSQPLYTYVVTDYPHGVNSPVQNNYANDTAHAAQPIVVTLSPTPDLRVDTVFTPNSSFTGSTISLTYKVKNYGVLTPANSYWYDKVYISQSPFFDANTATMLKYPKYNGTYYYGAGDVWVTNTNQLQQDSIYTKNLQVVIPNFLTPGAYYIYVFTNTNNTLYEGAFNNNNVNRNLMQIFLTPTPTLTVSALTIPSDIVSTTQTMGINWNIKNTGFNDNIERNKGHYGVKGLECIYSVVGCDANGQNCHVTGVAPGYILNDSLGWGSSYWKDKIYLSRDSSGFNVSNAVFLNRFLHGGDRSVGYFADFPPAPFGNCLALSVNAQQYSTNTQNVIVPQKDFPATANIVIPDTLSAGTYYLYVYANPEREVFEYPGTPQIRRSVVAITVQRPDAVVNTISAPPAAVGGQPMTLSYSVTNNGPGTVFSHTRKDRYFVSTSAVFDNSAVQIGTQTFTEGLTVGTPVPHTFSYTFPPATTGTRYLFVQTNYDSSFRESNQANNTSASAMVNVSPGSPADLVVSSIQLNDTLFTIYPQQFKYTVMNNGPAATNGNWTDSVFISCSNVYSVTGGIYIGKRLHNEVILSGGGYSDSFQINLPLSYYISGCFPFNDFGNAYFYVKTNAGITIYEAAAGNNNMTGSGLRVLRNPLVDQIVTQVTGADSATVGQPYTINWTVKNNGYNPGYPAYSPWMDAHYFSPDSLFNVNAIFHDYYSGFPMLNTGQTYSDSKTHVVPNIPTGDYYVLSYTNRFNQIPAEINLANNVNTIRNAAGAAKKIHVTRPLLPDLRDSILAASSVAAIGQPLTMVHQVTNEGPGNTTSGNWIDALWLSTDFTPGNSGDFILSYKTHTGTLLNGQSYLDTISPVIPLQVPPGNYILISHANHNRSQAETNLTNNLSYRYITVYSPAPVDLLVNDITHPDTVYLGYTMDSARWVIHNNSANTASGVSSDGVYLSMSSVLDSTAVLMGIKQKTINMGPLSDDHLVMSPMISGVTEGNYNLFIKTDIQRNINETDISNNIGVAPTPVYVKVKELPLNVLTAGTLQYTNRYYKLMIPDSLRGSTILLTLKSNDSLTVNNQLYVGGGYIPSAAQFDYAYGTPNYGNQQIIMSSVTDSVYYITIKCTSYYTPVQNITLKAVVLPFAIVNVDAASGGNSGPVTVKITGSLFTNNMLARLIRNSTIIHATSVYYINSTTVFATFNLRNQPLGLYDVKLVKTDSSSATLANGFSVVPPNNGGLLTGGGMNTGSGDGNVPGCDPGAAAGLNSQLSIELVSPVKVFGGWPFIIQVNFHNPTNNDIPAQTRVLYSMENLPLAYTSGTLNGAPSNLYLVLTEQNGPPGIIRAGGSGSIIVYSKAPVTYPAHTNVTFKIR